MKHDAVLVLCEHTDPVIFGLPDPVLLRILQRIYFYIFIYMSDRSDPDPDPDPFFSSEPDPGQKCLLIHNLLFH